MKRSAFLATLLCLALFKASAQTATISWMMPTNECSRDLHFRLLTGLNSQSSTNVMADLWASNCIIGGVGDTFIFAATLPVNSNELICVEAFNTDAISHKSTNISINVALYSILAPPSVDPPFAESPVVRPSGPNGK